MSSENNENQSRSEERKNHSPQKGFFYYFDIFYRVSKTLIVLFIVIALVLGSLGAGTAIGYFASLVYGSEIPEYEEMEQQINDIDLKSTMYYSGGEVISDLRTDLIRTPVSLDDVSPLLVDAVVSTEDEYFFEHEGVVPKAVARALVQDLTEAASTTGGSTLTQQLIKQQMIGDEVSHERKANEILLAMRIENYLDKEEILEAYLNVSPFGRNNKGENIAGVEEAAQGIFGISAAEVNLPQAAYIAGLPQSPIVYSPYTQYGELRENLDAGINRQRNVLFRMYREGYISLDEYNNAREYPIAEDFLNREELEYEDMSYVYDLAEREARSILMQQMLEEDGISNEDLEENEDLRSEYYERANRSLRNDGFRIYTTIDRDIHQALETVVEERRDSLGLPRDLTVTDSEGNTETITYPVQIGGTLIENETGRVIAFVGGLDYEESQYNNPFDSRRGTGSAIKPITVYGPALEEGIITPATIVPDTDYEVPHWEDGVLGTHPITNYGPTTEEWQSARHWLMTSQNIPASKIYMEMLENNVDPSVYARRLGIDEEGISDADFANPSTALGGYEYGPTITEVVGAYAAIANGGVHNEPFVIDRIEDSYGEIVYEHEFSETEVWSPQTNFMLLDMLRDVHSSGGTASGMMNQLNFNTDLMSKTGTTSGAVDLWYVGSTPQVTFGTWIGYDNQNLGLLDDFGLIPSQRNRNMWAHLMNAVYSTNPDIVGAGQSFAGAPSGITQQSVLTETGMRSGNVNLPDGDSVSISGNSYTEYFNSNNVPGTTTYDFALGATDEELDEFWFGQLPDEEEENNDEEEADEEDNNESVDEDQDESESNENETDNDEPEDESEENEDNGDNNESDDTNNDDSSDNGNEDALPPEEEESDEEEDTDDDGED